MKIKFPLVTGLLALCALVALMFVCHIITVPQALGFIALYQAACFCVSARKTGVFYIAALTAEQILEFQEIMQGMKDMGEDLKSLPGRVKALETENDSLKKKLANATKYALGMSPTGVRWIGNKPFVSEECAKGLTSMFVLECAGLKNGLETLVPDESRRKSVVAFARMNLGMQGIEHRAGGTLSTSDIPLPTIFMPQIVELVFAYGAARQFATVFPLGAGLVKLPRLQAGEDDFGFLGAGTAGNSANVPEKEVTAQLVTFTANKAGGLIRIPYELEEDTFIAIGQFLARYIARQFAKLEDKTLFMGDGTGAYANITGIAAYCAANPAYQWQLGAGKTMPSDATLNDFRQMRSMVNPAILGNMEANRQTSAAYYLHPSFEPTLRSFNTYPNFIVFEYVNGKPMLDGFPVHWIGVSQAYTTNAAPNTPLTFFGDLSYWYLGERGAPRVEVSKEVFFQTDELAMRALERIDVEAMAIDAMVTLQTAAQ